MFGFATSELALIGMVALVAIGPKDMPVAIRTVAKLLKRARALASEFQSHVDDMVRDAELGPEFGKGLSEVREHFNGLRHLSVPRVLDRTLDRDGALRRSLDLSPVPALAAPAADAPLVLVDLRPARAICRPPDFGGRSFGSGRRL